MVGLGHKVTVVVYIIYWLVGWFNRLPAVEGEVKGNSCDWLASCFPGTSDALLSGQDEKKKARIDIRTVN